MIDSTLLEQAIRAPNVLAMASVLFVAYLLRLISSRQQKLSLPVAELKGGTVTDSLMAARAEYPDTPFILPLKENWVILPHSLVNEVKNAPEDKLSFSRITYERMQSRYTDCPTGGHVEGTAAIRNDLTRNIAKVLSDLQDEVSFAFGKEIGDTSTWKEIGVYSTVLEIVASLSARTFVGLPLCRDPEWTKATINITTDTVTGVTAIGKYKPWVRPFVAPFVPELRRIKRYKALFASKIKPQVTAIVAAYKEKENMGMKPSGEDISDDDVTDENHSLVHWVIKNYKDPQKVTADDIGYIEIAAAFAAIHTTSMALSHAIFDLAAHPEYAEVLREEINAVIEEENYPDKMLRKNSMPKLRKLDSFMKESQRTSPPGMLNMTRMVVAKEGFPLSTGQRLPYGTFTGFGAPYYNNSTVPSNTVITGKSQPPLSEFYPWRYSDIRSLPGEENKHQFVTTDQNEIAFGTGKHACPGRFFASNEIKVVLIELLKRYDIGLGPHGEGDGQGGYTRPKLLEHDSFYAPDPYAKIWVRNKKV